MRFCNTEESVIHMLYECIEAEALWSLVRNALRIENTLNVYMIIFGQGQNNSSNHLFSIITYYIYREWLVPSLENRDRIRFQPAKFKTYLTYKANVYSNCRNPLWKDVCNELNLIRNLL